MLPSSAAAWELVAASRFRRAMMRSGLLAPVLRSFEDGKFSLPSSFSPC